MNEEGGRWESVGGLRVFLRDAGAGDALLLLHGIPTSSYLWRDVIPLLAPERRVIAPDLVGFGCSDKPRYRSYTVADQAEIVERLTETLGIERCGLVGHDLGALVAAELIARDAERYRSLILLNTSLRYAGWHGFSPLTLLRLPLLGEVAMLAARKWMLDLAMRIYVSRRSRLTAEVMDHYWWPFEHGFKAVLLRLYRTRMATSEDFSRWRDALSAFEAPALIAWGALDPTWGLDEAADIGRLLPGAERFVFAHANHFIQEDRPAALGRVIALFLEGKPLPEATLPLPAPASRSSP